MKHHDGDDDDEIDRDNIARNIGVSIISKSKHDTRPRRAGRLKAIHGKQQPKLLKLLAAAPIVHKLAQHTQK